MLDGLSKNFDIKVILRITFIFFFFGQTLDFFSDRPWTFRTSKKIKYFFNYFFINFLSYDNFFYFQFFLEHKYIVKKFFSHM